MKELFLSFLNVGINGSILIAAVVLTRFLFKKHNRGIICFLWGLVALRMLIPVNIPVELSLLPSAQSVSAEDVAAEVPVAETEPHRVPAADTAVNAGSNISVPVTEGLDKGEVQPPQVITPDEGSADRLPAYSAVTSDEKDTADETHMDVKDIFVRYGTVVWLVGMACMVIYFVICDIRLRLKTRVRYEKERGVYLCDDVKSPFVMGVIRPRIMLPSSTDEENEQYILMHERAHIERGDHIWKALAFAVLALHWYNPLVWLSFVLYSRDTELACDERVIRKNGTEIRKAYAHALLTYSMGKGGYVRGGWSFSQRSLTVRIKSVLNYKKPALWVFVSFGLACVVLVVCFMTVPVEGGDNEVIDAPVSATEDTSATLATEQTDSTTPTEGIQTTESSEPTEPEPTEPEPTEPEPTEPEPTEPEPTEPEPMYPSKAFNVLARDDMLDGKKMDLAVNSFGRCASFYNERMSFIDVPIKGAVVDGNTMRVGVSVAMSVDELRYNLCEKDMYGSSETMLIDSQYFAKYDDRYFEKNALIVIVDSIGSSTCIHSITQVCYVSGELSLNIKKRSSEPGVPEATGISRCFSVIEIPMTEIENIETISFYVERMEPHTEHMY